MVQAWDVIASELPKWWEQEKAREGPTFPEVVEGVVGTSPPEWLANLSGVGRLPKAARMLAGAIGFGGQSGEAEAGFSASARRQMLEAMSRYLRGAPKVDYHVSHEAPFKVVSSTPQHAVGVGAAADVPGSRAGTTGIYDPEAVRVAQSYTQQALGGDYSPGVARGVGSSLQKQSSIAAAAQEAARGGEGYQKAIYEGYGRALPEVMDYTGAKSYEELMDAAYRQLREETGAQFDLLGPKAGLRTRFHQGEGEYPSSRAMIEDVTRNRNLNVFQGGAEHPQLSTAIDPRTGLNANEQFRAVHDYFGHAGPGTQFGPKGEEMAYASHAQMFTPLAQLALAAETRGQNSIVNYSPLNAKLLARVNALKREDPEAARKLLGELQFAPNRGFLLPPEMVQTEYAGKMPDYVRSAMTPQHPQAPQTGFHWGPEGLTELDPARYGTGIKGAERQRLKYADNPRMPRSYFYTDPALREPGLGPRQYEGVVERLYGAGDPEGLHALSRLYNPMDEGQAFTDFERMAWERGYGGYDAPGSRAMLSFDPVKVKPR